MGKVENEIGEIISMRSLHTKAHTFASRTKPTHKPKLAKECASCQRSDSPYWHCYWPIKFTDRIKHQKYPQRHFPTINKSGLRIKTTTSNGTWRNRWLSLFNLKGLRLSSLIILSESKGLKKIKKALNLGIFLDRPKMLIWPVQVVLYKQYGC